MAKLYWMTHMWKMFLITTAGLAVAGAALSQASAQPPSPRVSVRSARVAAPDIERAAKFYEAAFGMQEVMRVDAPRRAIIMKFGDTVQQATDDPGVRLMVEQAAPDKAADAVIHIIFNVPNIDGAVQKGVAAGGMLVKAPTVTKRPDMTRVVAYLTDPAGNTLELLEERH